MYAILLSGEDTPVCLYKTAHYPLAMQTFSLIEKHSNTLSELGLTGPIYVSNDEALIQSLSRQTGINELIAALRKHERIPKPVFDITLAPGEYTVERCDGVM